MMTRSISRRGFVKTAAVTGAGVWIAGRGAWALGGAPERITSANEKLDVGFVGIAGRGGDDLHDTAATKLVNVVALCDVDDNNLARARTEFPKAATYNDFRKLLECEKIDALVIGTPDHSHAVAASAALRLGKHVYCEKPLTHTVKEARVVAELAAKYKRCTQMGTQIHAGENYRRVVEIVKAGVIGPITEAHVWCSKTWSASAMPQGTRPVPANLHYDLWVGPAPFIDYHPAFLPASWRRYWAYGDGTLGDMACHYTDLPFWALDLAHPTRVLAEGPEIIQGCHPKALTVHWDFPARGGLAPVKLSWYDGGRKPEKFSEWGLDPKWDNGVLFVGEKGMLFSDYGQHRLLPEKEFRDFTPPPKTIAPSIGHHREWVTACLHNDWQGTTCRFDYSAPLTEAVLLGNVAYRSGKTIEWNAKEMKIANAPEAEALLHYEYRKGWELS